MGVINLGIFLSGAELKFSRRVPNEHRLRLYYSARRVLAPAEAYPSFHGIETFEEISSEIGSLALSHLSRSCRRAGDDDRSAEHREFENFALHEGGRTVTNRINVARTFVTLFYQLP